MSDYVTQFAKYYQALGLPSLIYQDILWVPYKKIIQPFGPLKGNYAISRKAAKEILAKLNGLFIRWHTPSENSYETAWYAVIQDKFFDLDELKSKRRSNIKKALKNCEVKKVPANYIGEHGYEIHRETFKKYYGKNLTETKEVFQKMLNMDKDFENNIHYWGVFYEDILVAYAKIYIFDKKEANICVAKFHPHYLKYQISDAFFYVLGQYYLKQEKFNYINDGFRSIMHETNLQSKLISQFNFKKAYTKLNLIYKPSLNFFMNVTYPFHPVLSLFNPKLKSLYLQEKISRSTNK
jgi:hypothetical protein